MWPRQESNLYLELRKLLYYPLYYEARERCSFAHYLISPWALVAKILTAMASKTTPKNFRTAIKPAGPRILSMNLNDFSTRNTTTRFTIMASNTVVWS